MKKNLVFLVVALFVSLPICAAVAPGQSVPGQHGSAAPSSLRSQASDAQTSAFVQAIDGETSAFREGLARQESALSPAITGPDFKTNPNATARVFTVTATTAGDFGFIWNEISTTELNPDVVVNEGDDITINIKSANSIQHSIILESLEGGPTYINDTAITNSTKKIHFVASKAGTFFYFCNMSLCGTGHSNMVGNFIVQAAAAPPSISAIAPASGAASGGTSVTIIGSGFTSPVQVSFGGAAAVSVTFNSTSSITAVSPGGAAGPVDVKVSNPDGTSATTTFTYVAAPSITAITPVSGPTAGGTAITITGTGFQSGATVQVGGVTASSVSLLGSTTITATTPAHPTGDVPSLAVDVVVSNPDGQIATKSNAFTYNAPVVAALKANVVMVSSGPVSGGTAVTILGSGFTGGTLAVTFGGVPATSITVSSDTTATAVTPAHAAGLVDVVVTKQGSTATAAGAFRYADGTPSGPRKRDARH
jgi:hypothetical protein